MITTHVLDLDSGKAAAGVRVALLAVRNESRTAVATGITDDDGRLRDLVPSSRGLVEGTYELVFESGAWFSARGKACFHPRVVVTFEVTDAAAHYHVPLLLSPFGYTTYRGS